ncbi:MAG: 4Fe-4S binding protein, partial [Candidatus Sumerlaeia bacterium]|nr:4Fe-4S binding protein [Candidatus Sumerlaeia bacterium]
PLFITSPDRIEQLVWGPCCTNNLAVYVQRQFARTKKVRNASPIKIGIIAKKCDVRALVELIREKQLERSRLVVIGVPCTGVFDKSKLIHFAKGREILNLQVKGKEVIISGSKFTVTVNRDLILRENCLVCKEPENLPLVDIMLKGDEDYQKPFHEDDFADVKQYENQTPQERWQAFKSEFENCIRCNACRNVCPFCYCSECFAECSQPRWVGPSVGLKDVLFFQLVRILHQAGRCVDCGACASACPMGLDIRKYTRKVVKDAVEIFSFEPGVSLEDKPLLAVFSTEDRQDFITEPK